jgi:hypothetical protein
MHMFLHISLETRNTAHTVGRLHRVWSNKLHNPYSIIFCHLCSSYMFWPAQGHHHGGIWGFGDTQRQAQELISGSCPGAKARFLPFNRTQSKAVTGLLTGHNTLRRRLHVLGLLDSPLCRRRGAEEETSARILCEFEALTSLRHTYLGSFFLEPEDMKSSNWINKQDAATSQVYYLSFKYSSTCFGHPHAHHQELQQLQ